MGLLSREKINVCPGTDKCPGCALLYEKLQKTEEGMDSLCQRFSHPVSDLDKPQEGIRLCLKVGKNPVPASICDGAITTEHIGTMGFLTDPCETGKHYASRLALRMKEELRRAGADKLLFQIAPFNRHSQAIAQKLGARIVDDGGGVNYADPYDASDTWEMTY